MARLGDQVFLSYRGDCYPCAQRLGRWLVDNKCCASVVLFPPNLLSEDGEILLPYEYVELMEFILDRMARSDAFVFLNTKNYQDSYFTQAELLQWRRFKDNAMAYPVSVENNHFRLGSGMPLESLSRNEKKLWSGISVGIARSYRHHLNPGFACAKYAKNCFMIPCRKCGEHFVASKKAVYKNLGRQFIIRCPHCGNDRFCFEEGGSVGNFYRKPIILKQPDKNRLRILTPHEILGLLIDDELPNLIGLVTLDGEKLGSDLVKLGKVYLGLGVLMAGAIGLAEVFGGTKEGKN